MMKERELIEKRLELDIREYLKILKNKNHSSTRLKRLGIEIRRSMLMLEDNYWEYSSMEADNGYSQKNVIDVGSTTIYTTIKKILTKLTLLFLLTQISETNIIVIKLSIYVQIV